MSLRRIFSGIQPTGVPHIGNYLGAIRNWVHLQNTAANDELLMFCVVDLHSCTTNHAPEQLNDNIYNMVAALLACGIDPNKSLLFQQSQVTHHSSLAWFLSCLSPVGQLKRMHQWKSKTGKGKEKSNLGLFSYPVLMAADILLYRATKVPVGNDQLQHIELARDLTESFNKKYGKLFEMPEVVFTETPRIMGLRNPKEKMSKSDNNPNSRIELSNTDDEIRVLIQKAVTDSDPFITKDLSDRPGVKNLVDILCAFSGQTTTQVIEKYAGVQHFTRDLKNETFESTLSTLNPIRDQYNQLIRDRDYLRKILRDGSERADEIACETMNCVYQLLGMR